MSVHPWLPHIASLEQNSPTATWHEALAHAQCLPYLRAPFVAAEAASSAARGEAELCSRALCFISLPVSTGEMVSAARDRAAPAGAVPADSIAAWWCCAFPRRGPDPGLLGEERLVPTRAGRAAGVSLCPTALASRESFALALVLVRARVSLQFLRAVQLVVFVAVLGV